MNKQELVNAISDQTGLTKAKSSEALDAVIAAVKTSLKKGDKVSLPNFGTFAVSKQAAKMGRNPRDGSTIKIPARNRPTFKAGKGLKEAVNK